MKHRKAVGMLGVATVIIAASVVGGRIVLAQKAQNQSQIQRPNIEARTPGPLIRRDWFVDGDGSWLGVTIKDVTAETAREMKLPGEYGAVVDRVTPDSPAAKAGIQTNDVILQFAGERVRSVAELERLVRETPPGRTVSVELSRNGETRTVNVELAKREDAFTTLIGPVPPMKSFPHVEIPNVHIPRFDFHFDYLGAARLGISAEDLTPQLARYFGVKQGKGVLVNEVMTGSPAEKAGLKAGDCVVKAGDTEIDSVGALRRALAELVDKAPNEKHQVMLTLIRDRREQTVNVEIESAWHPSDQEVAELGIGPSLKEYRALVEQMKSDKFQQQLKALQKQMQKAAEQVNSDQYQQQLKALQKQMEDQKSELQKTIREQLSPERQKLLQNLRRELQDLKRQTSGVAI